MGALITAALLFDVLYLAVGPGVAPMANTCFGGMDCIGRFLAHRSLATGSFWPAPEFFPCRLP